VENFDQDILKSVSSNVIFTALAFNGSREIHLEC